MPIKKQDEETVRNFCAKRQYVDARNFLYGKKTTYERGNPVSRHSFFLHLGKCLTQLGEYDKADDAFNHALNANPSSIPTKLSQAESYIQRGTLKKAEIILYELMDKGNLRNDFVFLKMAGRFFKITGHYKTALYCLDKIISNSPEEMGSIQHELSFIEKVIKDEGIDQFAGVASYSFHLAKNVSANTEKNQKNLGVIFLENQIKEETNNIRKSALYSLLSRIHFELTNFEEAGKYIEKALALNENNKHAVSNKICLNLIYKKVDDANDILTSSQQLVNSDPNILIRLAFSFRKADAHEIAYKLAEKALELDGENPDIRLPATAIAHSIAEYFQKNAKPEQVQIFDPKSKVCALLTPVRN